MQLDFVLLTVELVQLSAEIPAHVPAPYKAGGFPLDDPEGVPGGALIAASEHGVLGTRWIHDGVHDPVVMAQLRVLLRGAAMPQHQSRSDTPDSAYLVAGWTWPDGTAARDVLAAVALR